MKKIVRFFRKLGDEDYEDTDEIDKEKVELFTVQGTSGTTAEDSGNPGVVHLSSYPNFSRDLPRLISRKTYHYRVKRTNQHIIRRSLLNFTTIYHLMISWSWWKLLIVLIVFHLILHLLFALLYFAAGSDTLGGLNPDFNEGDYTPYAFMQCFFFSVQTMFTIGYGGLYPKSVYANSLVVIQSFLGLFTSTLVVTLSVAKFSRPTKLRKRIIFSKVAVLNHVGYFTKQDIFNDISSRGQQSAIPPQPFKDSVPMFLMFRFVNTRKTQFISTRLRLLMVEWRSDEDRMEHEKKTNEHANEVVKQQEKRRRRKNQGFISHYIESSTGMKPNHERTQSSIINVSEEAELYISNDEETPTESSALSSFFRKKEKKVGVFPVVSELYFQLNNQTGKCMDIDLSAPLLCLPFTVVHPITMDSPLYPYLTDPHARNGSNTEIIACFDAVDEATSGNVQARYSYTMNDIILDHEFAPCVFRDKDLLEIDYDALNAIRPVKL